MEERASWARGCSLRKKTSEWVKALVIQACPTLCDPVDSSPPGSSVHGILQARTLEWVAIPFSRESSQPKGRTPISYITGRFFTVWATREALWTEGGPVFVTLKPPSLWSFVAATTGHWYSVFEASSGESPPHGSAEIGRANSWRAWLTMGKNYGGLLESSKQF